MSNKKDKGPDRRSVHTTAAAVAGAALPLVSVSAAAEGRGTRVVVDLGGVTLPEGIAMKLDSEIRRACLSAVAQGAPRTKFTNGPLGPGILGLILVPVGLPHGGMMTPMTPRNRM